MPAINRPFRQGRKALLLLLTALAALLFVFPIYIAVITSFKTPLEIAESILALPQRLRLDNYIDGMRESQFARSLLNSVIVTFPAVFMIVVFSAMGGYAIARNAKNNRLIRLLDKLYLSSLMIPFQVIMIPVYKTFKDLGLLNTLRGMILMLTGYSIAYPTFLIVGFVKSVPREMEEAAARSDAFSALFFRCSSRSLPRWQPCMSCGCGMTIILQSFCCRRMRSGR